MAFDVESVRKDFPILKRKIHDVPLVYLDNAASTLKPQCVIDEVTNHYTWETSNIHRGIHWLSENGTMKYEKTREKVRNFINARSSSEVIFTKGTTEGLNLVANCLGELILEKDDVILLTTLEHHSNIVPWQMIAGKKGALVKEIPINDRGEIDLEAYKKLLGPKVKIVSTSAISNALGTINPLEEMIPLAHEHGALFVVDAAQSVSHMATDVQKLDCDFLAFSGHKIFGPTGIGILYGKEEWLEKMPPYQGGGDMIDKVSFNGTTWNELPHKFEAGTPNIAGGIALKSALDYVSTLGLENIYKYEKELLSYATEKLLEVEGLKIIGTAANKASVISFVIDGIHPQDLATLLDRQGIAVRTGHHCAQPVMERFGLTSTARASLAFYNTKGEIDELVAAIYKAKELL